MDDVGLVTALSKELGALYSLLSSDQITQACYQAKQELAITFPLSETDQDRCIWVIRRAKRHATEIVATSAAYGFDFKQAKLSNRFTQLMKLIEKWDKDFDDEANTNPGIVSGNGIKDRDLFGQARRVGTFYSRTGRDLTAVTDNQGNYTPDGMESS